MTPQEAAALLDGNEYREEGSAELFARMKEAGLVAVFGASDDLIELRGAIYDEAGAGGNGVGYTFITRAGLVELEDCHCLHANVFHAKVEAKAARIKAIWCPQTGGSWAYETTIPHETFRIMEDGELYCTGIMFRLADVPEVVL